MDGSLWATHTVDSTGPSDYANVTATMLTDTTYTDDTFTVQSDIFSLNGEFTSISNNNGADGLNSALGYFRWTNASISGNSVMAFNFGSGTTPVTDSWTRSVAAGTTTEIHTANGNFNLSISAPGARPMTLGITLASLEDKLVTSAAGEDEWINGSISIGWTPDLSQWGCLNGTYTFTTIAPMHSVPVNCPTFGVLRVNNARIQFGVPTGYNATVTLDSGPSEVFGDCRSLGGDRCSL